MKRSLLLLLCLSILLQGCNGLEPQNNAVSNEEQSELIKKETLDEIWSTWDETLSFQYENIDFVEGIKLEKPEEISVSKFVQAGNVLDSEKQIFDTFLSGKMKKKYYRKNPNTDPPGPEYVDSKTGEQLYLGDMGFLYYIKNFAAEGYEEDSNETIYLNRKYEDREVELRDGKILLSEAVLLAEKMTTKWKKITHDEFDVRIHKVEICNSKNNKEKKVLVFYFEKCYKGVNTLVERKTLWTDADTPLALEYIPCYDDKVTVSSCEEADVFLTNTGIVKKKETVTVLDKIISLESALKILQERMAGYHKNTVKKIALSYRFCNPKGETCKHRAGEEYETSPCWVFYFNEEVNKEEFALVDCQTGAIDYIRNY